MKPALVVLRILALIFALVSGAGYGWWDRSYLTTFGRIFMLTPMLALLAIVVTPDRMGWAAVRWFLIPLSLIGVARLVMDIRSDWMLSDTAAIALRATMGGILLLTVYLRRRWLKITPYVP